MLAVWLTQVSEDLHPQHSVDEKDENKQETNIANLEAKHRLVPHNSDPGSSRAG